MYESLYFTDDESNISKTATVRKSWILQVACAKGCFFNIVNSDDAMLWFCLASWSFNSSDVRSFFKITELFDPTFKFQEGNYQMYLVNYSIKWQQKNGSLRESDRAGRNCAWTWACDKCKVGQDGLASGKHSITTMALPMYL